MLHVFFALSSKNRLLQAVPLRLIQSAQISVICVISGRLFDFRHLFAYSVPMDDQKRSGLVVLAASIICCIRLKGVDIRPSPKLTATVSDSVHLAQMIVEAVE